MSSPYYTSDPPDLPESIKLFGWLIVIMAIVLMLSSCSPQCYVQEVVCYKSYENGYTQYDFVPTVDSAAIRYYEQNRMFYYEVDAQDYSITVPRWDTIWVEQKLINR